MNFILLQAEIDPALVAEGGEKTMNVLEMLLKGGLLFIIPILILSILAVYIFFERFFAIRNAGKMNAGFMNNIREYIISGNVTAAETICKNEDSPISRMIAKGLKRIGKPLKNISMTLDSVGKLEVLQMEKNLAGLATIAGTAPMIGFLGTVVGMIKAFFTMSNAGNNIEPGMLAGGIYQALMTTAAGLTVGIIALIGYNFLVSQISKVVYKMEAAQVEFLEVLQEPAA